MLTRKTMTLATTAAATTVLLASCGSSDGAPQPPPPDPLHGAPKVQNPITDTANFEQNPCSLLTQQQLDRLHVGAEGKPQNGRGTQGCRWMDLTGPSNSLTTVKFMKQGDGLKFLYQLRDTYKVFREDPPTYGYPTVTAMSDKPPEQTGRCDVHVGINDDRFITVQTSLDKSNKSIDSSDPCGRAKSVATDVMQTLKKG